MKRKPKILLKSTAMIKASVLSRVLESDNKTILSGLIQLPEGIIFDVNNSGKSF